MFSYFNFFIIVPKAFLLRDISEMEHVLCMSFERLAASSQPKTPEPVPYSRLAKPFPLTPKHHSK